MIIILSKKVKSAKKRVLSSIPDIVHELEDRKKKSADQNPDVSEFMLLVFDPPPKKTLFQKFLDDGVLRKLGMGCRSTFSLSSKRDSRGRMRLHSHVLTGQPVRFSTPLTFVAKGKEDEENEGGVADNTPLGAAGPDGWKRTRVSSPGPSRKGGCFPEGADSSKGFRRCSAQAFARQSYASGEL